MFMHNNLNWIRVQFRERKMRKRAKMESLEVVVEYHWSRYLERVLLFLDSLGSFIKAVTLELGRRISNTRSSKSHVIPEHVKF